MHRPNSVTKLITPLNLQWVAKVEVLPCGVNTGSATDISGSVTVTSSGWISWL